MDEVQGIVNDKSEILGVKQALDAYMNGPANIGANANNLAETGGYILSRLSWDYYTLNTLFRNNWIAKAIIEKPANEMLKNGFEIHSQIAPDKIEKIMNVWTKTKSKDKFLKCLKWARLYGGCLLVPMIKDAGNLEEPLDYDNIMPDSFKGSFTVDRWSGVSPSIELVTDIEDPEFGLPEYYIVTDNASHTTLKIHHSRCIRMIGRELPYWEEIAETWWGASELEHVFTELKKRDDTSANISFLIFLANIRVFKSQGLSQMLTLGDQEAAQKVYQSMQTMNHLMCNTGTLAIDKDDDFAEHQYSFTGINDVYESFMLDIAGASEIPVDKLFGRSPTGFNSGDETLQNYYDTMQEKQETYARPALEKLIKIITMSALGEIPDDLEIVFNPIRRSSNMEKSDLASKMTQPILDALSAGVIGKATALREMKQQSPLTGVWTNITDEMIMEAEKEDEEEKENKKMEQEMMLNAANGDEEDDNENTDKPEKKNPSEKGTEKSNGSSKLRSLLHGKWD